MGRNVAWQASCRTQCPTTKSDGAQNLGDTCSSETERSAYVTWTVDPDRGRRGVTQEGLGIREWASGFRGSQAEWEGLVWPWKCGPGQGERVGLLPKP